MSQPGELEKSLVARAQDGDREAIADIYRRFADRLYRQVIYPCVGNAALAEDILKETFVTMIEQISSFRWEPSRGLFPWLATIARNRSLDRHRKHARHDRLHGAYRQHLDHMTQQATPDQLLEEREEQALARQHVHACLEVLNPRYRRALELRMFQELSREECARQLEVQVGTFDVVYYRALKAFRSVWERRFAAQAP